MGEGRENLHRLKEHNPNTVVTRVAEARLKSYRIGNEEEDRESRNCAGTEGLWCGGMRDGHPSQRLYNRPRRAREPSPTRLERLCGHSANAVRPDASLDDRRSD